MFLRGEWLYHSNAFDALSFDERIQYIHNEHSYENRDMLRWNEDSGCWKFVECKMWLGHVTEIHTTAVKRYILVGDKV